MLRLPDFDALERVLVVKPSSLGDIVHTLPAVEALARRHSHWQLDWVANPEWLPLIENHSALHGTISFPRAHLRGARTPRRFLRWASQLRDGGDYQLALDFQGLLRSALIARGSGARWRLGLADAREGAGCFYQARAAVDGRLHALERYLALAELCGVEIESAATLPLPELPVGRCPAKAEGEGLEEGDFLVVHPFSRGEGKALDSVEILRLLEGLAPRRVVLIGRAGEVERPSVLPGHVLDLVNATTLAELCWLLRRSAATISVDSGPMHLAAACPAPLLSLHAWSDPRQVGPWRADAAIWKAGQLATRESIDPGLAAGPGELGRAGVDAALAWAQTVSA